MKCVYDADKGEFTMSWDSSIVKCSTGLKGKTLYPFAQLYSPNNEVLVKFG